MDCCVVLWEVYADALDPEGSEVFELGRLGTSASQWVCATAMSSSCLSPSWASV